MIYFNMAPEIELLRFKNASDLVRSAAKVSEFWIEPDAYLRYAPVIEWFQKSSCNQTKALEVGSGDFGLSTYLSLPVTKVDLSFSKRKSSGHRISANATALPFRNNTFDLACAIDLLEHVPAQHRFPVISELVRVSRRDVILTFPSGEKARASDLKIAEQFLKNTGKSLEILDVHAEHLFPSKVELIEWCNKLQKAGHRTRFKKSFNLLIRERLILDWLYKRKRAQVWAERVINHSIVKQLISGGNCYRQTLWIVKSSSAHNNHQAQSHSIQARVEQL